jgi:hypothetical protein
VTSGCTPRRCAWTRMSVLPATSLSLSLSLSQALSGSLSLSLSGSLSHSLCLSRELSGRRAASPQVASELLQVPLGSWVHEKCCPAMGLHAVAVLQPSRSHVPTEPRFETELAPDNDDHREQEEEQAEQEERARGSSPAVEVHPTSSGSHSQRDAASPWRASRSCSPMSLPAHGSLEAARHSSIIHSANRRLERQREAGQQADASAAAEATQEQEPPGGYDPERPERQPADDDGEVVAWGAAAAAAAAAVAAVAQVCANPTQAYVNPTQCVC